MWRPPKKVLDQFNNAFVGGLHALVFIVVLTCEALAFGKWLGPWFVERFGAFQGFAGVAVGISVGAVLVVAALASTRAILKVILAQS